MTIRPASETAWQPSITRWMLDAVLARAGGGEPISEGMQDYSLAPPLVRTDTLSGPVASQQEPPYPTLRLHGVDVTFSGTGEG